MYFTQSTTLYYRKIDIRLASLCKIIFLLYIELKMKFCEQCDNMYYISVNVDDPNKLEHYCRNCKHVDTTIAQDGGCILDVQSNNTEQHLSRIVNKYTKHDPTLPRSFTMKCASDKCKSNMTEPFVNPEIVYIRYDDANMKYLYICTVCDTTWKTNQHK